MKIVIIFLFLFASLTFILIGCGQLNYADVCTNNFCFNAEIAETNAAKKTGLINRQNIADNEAMLFVYEQPGDYSIWMKNMKFAIDIIWINENYKIVDYKKNTPVCKQELCKIYKSKKPAKYILETKTGKIDELNLQINDVLLINQTF